MKNPVVALFLSLLFMGLGQLYNRQLVKGLLLVIINVVWLPLFFGASVQFGGINNPTPTFVVAWLILSAVQIWSMWDAYWGARRINTSAVVD